MSGRWFRGFAVFALLVALAAAWAYGSPRASAAGAGSGAFLGVASGSGQVRIAQPGSWRELALPVALSMSLDARFAAGVDVAPTGRGANVVVVARRQQSVGEYRMRARITSAWSVELSVVRVTGATRVTVAQAPGLYGIVSAPGDRLMMRVSVSSDATPTIKVKAWRAGTGEPSSWTLSTTDASPALAGSGWSGVRFGIGASATGVPITFAYAGLRAQTSDSSANVGGHPGPTPTPTPTLSPTQAPSATPTPAASATPTPTPTASPSAGASSPAALAPNARFVAPFGNDSAAGTADSPWQTLQKAADTVSTGQTVYVRSGTFDGFTLRRSGTASAPVTFAAYPGEQPVVDGRGVRGYTIELVGVSHAVIDSLTIQGGYMDRQAGGGIAIEGCSYVTLRHSVLRDNHSFGVRTENSTNVVIDDNDVYGNAVGVHIGRLGAGTVVSNNRIHDNDLMMVNTPDIAGDDAGGEGVAIVHSSGPLTISGNLIWANRAQSYDYGYDGGAFSIYAASNWTITGNVTWDNRNVLETGTDANKTPCDGGSFTRNLNYGATSVDRTVGMVLRCASNTLVANNTFYGLQYFVFDISHMQGSWGGSTDGLRVVNNVISVSTGKVYGIDTALPASVVIDHNVVYDSGPGYLATYLGQGTKSLVQLTTWTGEEAHGIAADPRFVDPSSNDFRLSATSVALDAGVVLPGVTDGYSGSAPDLGYAERR